MDETFDSTLEHGSGSSVVSVSGEVDVATAPELRGRLDEAIEQAPALLVVDLTKVSFIDSTALGVLIGARERCTAAGVTIRLVVTEARILKIFEITGLTELFDIRGSREEAVAQ